jgi:NAD(P)-dependent dehydrogenase (short-subunit alcohol dehydrogenase family)
LGGRLGAYPLLMVQRVIVTAAASGIGRVTAEAFQAQGAEVRVCDVDDAALIQCRTNNPGLNPARVDLADTAAIDRWLDEALDDLGGIDVLVNNAGIKGPTAFVEDVSIAEWRASLAISLDSHFACARRVAPLMKAQGHGSIINMSSTAGLVGFGLRTPYAAAKWAVIGLTKSMAIELGPHNVTCNCICPGSVRGDRMKHVVATEAAERGVSPETVQAEYVNGQSIKRFVEPTEVAGLCLFLASPAAAMITGQALTIDGHSETYHI